MQITQVMQVTQAMLIMLIVLQRILDQTEHRAATAQQVKELQAARTATQKTAIQTVLQIVQKAVTELRIARIADISNWDIIA